MSDPKPVTTPQSFPVREPGPRYLNRRPNYRNLRQSLTCATNAKKRDSKSNLSEEQLYQILYWLQGASAPPAWAVDCYVRRQLGQPESEKYSVKGNSGTSFGACCADVLDGISWLDERAYGAAKTLKYALCIIARDPEKMPSKKRTLSHHKLWPLDIQQAQHRSPALVADAQPNASDAPASAAGGAACGDASNGSEMNHQPQAADLTGKSVPSPID